MSGITVRWLNGDCEVYGGERYIETPTLRQMIAERHNLRASSIHLENNDNERSGDGDVNIDYFLLVVPRPHVYMTDASPVHLSARVLAEMVNENLLHGWLNTLSLDQLPCALFRNPHPLVTEYILAHEGAFRHSHANPAEEVVDRWLRNISVSVSNMDWSQLCSNPNPRMIEAVIAHHREQAKSIHTIAQTEWFQIQAFAKHECEASVQYLWQTFGPMYMTHCTEMIYNDHPVAIEWRLKFQSVIAQFWMAAAFSRHPQMVEAFVEHLRILAASTTNGAHGMSDKTNLRMLLTYFAENESDEAVEWWLARPRLVEEYAHSICANKHTRVVEWVLSHASTVLKVVPFLKNVHPAAVEWSVKWLETAFEDGMRFDRVTDAVCANGSSEMFWWAYRRGWFQSRPNEMLRQVAYMNEVEVDVV